MTDYIYDSAEHQVRDYLREVQDVPAHVEAPRQLPARFIKVQTIGGSEAVVTRKSLLLVECWDEARLPAAKLAEETVKHLKQCAHLGGAPVYQPKCSVPIYRPDESGRHRYQFTLELPVRGRNP